MRRSGRSMNRKDRDRGAEMRLFFGNIFGFYKTRHILLSNSANCTVLRAVVLAQYRRVTDGRTDRQTDGIAIASAALAMRALRRAVKNTGMICLVRDSVIPRLHDTTGCQTRCQTGLTTRLTTGCIV